MPLPRSLLPHSLVVALSVTGCLQGIGDRCQLDSDCAGYGEKKAYCAVPAGDRGTGGTCQEQGAMGEMSVVTDMAAAPGDMAADLAAAPGDMVPELDLTVPPDVAAPAPDLTSAPDGAGDGG